MSCSITWFLCLDRPEGHIISEGIKTMKIQIMTLTNHRSIARMTSQHKKRFTTKKLPLSPSDLKEITTNLQSDIDAKTSFCNKWGLKINKPKTTYMVFTTAGRRSSYQKTYKLDLRIVSARDIPQERSPVFLGIKLDPKLSCKSHLEHITAKTINRTRLIRKVKSLKSHNQTSSSSPLLDHAFIPIISPIQMIAGKLQDRLVGFSIYLFGMYFFALLKMFFNHIISNSSVVIICKSYNLYLNNGYCLEYPTLWIRNNDYIFRIFLRRESHCTRSHLIKMPP